VSYGIRRSAYQVLPKSGARITCVEINDDGQATHEWWMRSIESWGHMLPEPLKIYLEKIDDKMVLKDWIFVLVAPLASVQQFWCGNDGLTGWMRNQDQEFGGYLIPDHCRQTGGCPEVWNVSEVKGKRELPIMNLTEIEDLVVLDHSQRSSRPFPESGLQSVSPTS
jgi:hypothetical protein